MPVFACVVWCPSGFDWSKESIDKSVEEGSRCWDEEDSEKKSGNRGGGGDWKRMSIVEGDEVEDEDNIFSPTGPPPVYAHMVSGLSAEPSASSSAALTLPPPPGLHLSRKQIDAERELYTKITDLSRLKPCTPGEMTSPKKGPAASTHPTNPTPASSPPAYNIPAQGGGALAYLPHATHSPSLSLPTDYSEVLNGGTNSHLQSSPTADDSYVLKAHSPSAAPATPSSPLTADNTPVLYTGSFTHIPSAARAPSSSSLPPDDLESDLSASALAHLPSATLSSPVTADNTPVQYTGSFTHILSAAPAPSSSFPPPNDISIPGTSAIAHLPFVAPAADVSLSAGVAPTSATCTVSARIPHEAPLLPPPAAATASLAADLTNHAYTATPPAKVCTILRGQKLTIFSQLEPCLLGGSDCSTERAKTLLLLFAQIQLHKDCLHAFVLYLKERVHLFETLHTYVLSSSLSTSPSSSSPVLSTCFPSRAVSLTALIGVLGFLPHAEQALRFIDQRLCENAAFNAAWVSVLETNRRPLGAISPLAYKEIKEKTVSFFSFSLSLFFCISPVFVYFFFLPFLGRLALIVSYLSFHFFCILLFLSNRMTLPWKLHACVVAGVTHLLQS